MLALASCGSDSSSEEVTTDTVVTEDTMATTDTEAPSAAVSLADVCPETVIFQTDWNPESEHGFLYQLVGDGYTVDTKKVSVSGPLVAGGVDTGVKVEVRSGGPAIGYQQVTALLYSDPTIMLGFVSTDEAVSHSVDFPTKAVVAPYNINPQIIMWDPASHPDVKTIADLKTDKVKVRYFDGAAYMDYFTQTEILDKGQVDGSYDGQPASFIASGGKDAQQGFGRERLPRRGRGRCDPAWPRDHGPSRLAQGRSSARARRRGAPLQRGGPARHRLHRPARALRGA